MVLAPPSLGAGDRIRREVKKMDLSLGSRIDWPWKQTETPKGQPGGLVSRKAWKMSGRLQRFKTDSGTA